MKLAAAAVSVAVLLGAAAPAARADIVIVNLDGAAEGFNDPTPAAPVGGNPGTTIGAQRLAVFERAADLMEQIAPSPIDIRVEAAFNPLFCASFGATIGSAGAIDYARDFAGAPHGGTWYPIALANKLASADLDPGANDIVATFNSTIGTTCAFPNEFYYGLDGSPPGSDIDLMTVVLHELAHGLGFATLVVLSTGEKGIGTGVDDAYMRLLENHDTGELYPQMTNDERVAASVSTGALHWVGEAVVDGAAGLTEGRDAASGHVLVYAPNPQVQGSSVSHFDTTLTPSQLMEPSYVGPNHDLGLTARLFEDIGWTEPAGTTTTAGPPASSTSSTTTTTAAAPTTSLPVSTSVSSTTQPPTTTTTVPVTTTVPIGTTSLPVTSTLGTTSTTVPATFPASTTTTLPAAATTTTLGATTTTAAAATTTTTPSPPTTRPTTSTTLPPPTTGATTTTTLDATTTTLSAAPACGDPTASGGVTASDALAVLQAAVGALPCDACVCDVDGSGVVTASDALAVLRRAVGASTPFECPACSPA